MEVGHGGWAWRMGMEVGQGGWAWRFLSLAFCGRYSVGIP